MAAMRRQWRAVLLALVVALCVTVGAVVGVARSQRASRAVGRFLPPALVHSPTGMLVQTCARSPVTPGQGWCGSTPVIFRFGQPTPWCQYAVPLWRAEIERQRFNRRGARFNPTGAGMSCPP